MRELGSELEEAWPAYAWAVEMEQDIRDGVLVLDDEDEEPVALAADMISNF